MGRNCAAVSTNDESAAAQFAPCYNICPTDPVDVVTEREGKRDFDRMRWGLVPSWWPKTLKELRAATSNARAETVAEKPFFRDAFRRTRCLPEDSGRFSCEFVWSSHLRKKPRPVCQPTLRSLDGASARPVEAWTNLSA
jgi:SOS response associated peptidase (SRAP)